MQLCCHPAAMNCSCCQFWLSKICVIILGITEKKRLGQQSQLSVSWLSSGKKTIASLVKFFSMNKLWTVLKHLRQEVNLFFRIPSRFEKFQSEDKGYPLKTRIGVLFPLINCSTSNFDSCCLFISAQQRNSYFFHWIFNFAFSWYCFAEFVELQNFNQSCIHFWIICSVELRQNCCGVVLKTSRSTNLNYAMISTLQKSTVATKGTESHFRTEMFIFQAVSSKAEWIHFNVEVSIENNSEIGRNL